MWVIVQTWVFDNLKDAIAEYDDPGRRTTKRKYREIRRGGTGNIEGAVCTGPRGAEDLP